MPKPILLHPRALRPHLLPPPAPAPETNDQRRDRQLALARELTDLNMLAARDAAHRIATRPDDPEEPAPAAADPTLALARATRSVTQLIGLENRVAAGEVAAIAPNDPRAIGLREMLHPLLAIEPDPVRRRAMRVQLDARVDDALAIDLDDTLCLADIATVIAGEFGLHLDLAKVHDIYLQPVGAPLKAPPPPGPDGQRPPRFHAVHPPEPPTPHPRT